MISLSLTHIHAHTHAPSGAARRGRAKKQQVSAFPFLFFIQSRSRIINFLRSDALDPSNQSIYLVRFRSRVTIPIYFPLGISKGRRDGVRLFHFPLLLD